jgi:lipopolysaccharide transport system permease protein
VEREFRSRYLGSLLGASWAILNPLAMILIYTVIFSQIMKARLPGIESVFGYSIYLVSGLLPWNLFAEILGRSHSVFIENGNLIKKSSFPRASLPVIAMISAGLNFSIVFALFLAFLMLIGNFPGLVVLTVLPVLLIQMTFAGGLGIFLGTLNVFFRDIAQMMGIVLQFWFWLTPIVYPIDIIPERFRWVASLNPLTSLITAYHDIFVRQQSPQWESLMPVVLLSAFIAWFGLTVFRRNAGELVDEL